MEFVSFITVTEIHQLPKAVLLLKIFKTSLTDFFWPEEWNPP
jgi:hypothetical protein